MLIDNEKTISDYTESEFIDLLSNFFENKHGLNASDFGKFKSILNADKFEGIVTKVITKGKMIVIFLDNGMAGISTLGMGGWWYPSKIPPNVAKRTVYYQSKIFYAIYTCFK